uniref:GSKIP domain-containing protein n=1 Tax=Bracon brevicornis TaxID=1563983 RepID=A0A6V7IML4_9HYME
MYGNRERILDAEQWKVEAQAIIDDVKSHVHDIAISEKLQSTNSSIYLNLTTLEHLRLTIQISADGFRIIGNQHDTVTDANVAETFETPYSLLDFISPQYRQSFSSALTAKLNKLEQKQ